MSLTVRTWSSKNRNIFRGVIDYLFLLKALGIVAKTFWMIVSVMVDIFKWVVVVVVVVVREVFTMSGAVHPNLTQYSRVIKPAERPSLLPEP